MGQDPPLQAARTRPRWGDDRDRQGSEHSAGRVHYSPLSLVELTLKQMMGRLRLPEGPDELLPEQGRRRSPSPTATHWRSRGFGELVRHDPDRLLLGQAATGRADFQAADRRLLSLDLDWVHDAEG